jgi:manganese transport protein
MSDPWTERPDAVRPPPVRWADRWRQLGPSVVIAGSIVGSGELVLTSTLGATAGVALLWWLLVCCWSKSIVQAELARYVVSSGDTYLRALNRLPGRLPGRRTQVSWVLWFSLFAFMPGVVGMGGIVGGAAQALELLAPGIDARVWTVLAAGAASALLVSGSYVRLERVMVALVVCFTGATLLAFVALEFSADRLTMAQLATGFEFRIPAHTVVLALAVYGATGVNSAEICTYTYWCIEKGYARRIGDDRAAPDWPARARGWIRVLDLDVWTTLLILTCATLPFYLLGAGVLAGSERSPQGSATLSTLSTMFTHTLGPRALPLFGLAAFCILFSSVVAGCGGISRLVPDYLVEFGLLEREDLVRRLRWIRGCGGVLPLAAAAFYLFVPNLVVLLTIGALTGAVLLPVQSGATLWLHRHWLDERVRPSAATRVLLRLTFLFQALMAGAVVWSVLHVGTS